MRPFLGMAICPVCLMRRSITQDPGGPVRFGRHNTASGFAQCRGSNREVQS